jgi:hypothetical protein
VRLCENPPRNSQKRTHTMAPRSGCPVSVGTARSVDGGEVLPRLVQALIEAEATAQIGAAPNYKSRVIVADW